MFCPSMMKTLVCPAICTTGVVPAALRRAEGPLAAGGTTPPGWQETSSSVSSGQKRVFIGIILLHILCWGACRSAAVFRPVFCELDETQRFIQEIGPRAAGAYGERPFDQWIPTPVELGLGPFCCHGFGDDGAVFERVQYAAHGDHGEGMVGTVMLAQPGRVFEHWEPPFVQGAHHRLADLIGRDR